MSSLKLHYKRYVQLKKIYPLLLVTLFSYSLQAQCWKTVAAGIDHTIAIRPDGTLWAWGFNGSGQLGDGTLENRKTPVQVGSATDWKTVIAGGNQSFAIKDDGTVWAWGDNFYGQLGLGTFGTTEKAPKKVGTDTDWKSISAGRTFTLAIKSNGTLWAWGDNILGQLGNPTATAAFVPTQVGADTNWNTVSAGGVHTLAVRTDGTLWAWGFNAFGEVGDGTTEDKTTPTKIGTATDWNTVSAGYGHSLAIKNDGSLWGWGDNDEGAIGDGTFVRKNVPTRAGVANNWKSVSAGMSNSLAIKTDGTIHAWGRVIGTFGSGNEVNSPTALIAGTNWEQNFSGEQHSFALQTDGTLWGWGDNNWGKLGDNTAIDNPEPKIISTPIPTGNVLQTFCSPATVADLQAEGTNIKWYAAASGGSELLASQALVDGNHYYATQTISSCEANYRLDVEVLINLVPTPAPTGDALQIFCGSTTVADLQATGSGIRWYTAPTGDIALESSTGLIDETDYFASQTVNFCESQERLTVRFILKRTPAPTDINSPLVVCEGTPIGALIANTYWYEEATGGTKLPNATQIIDGNTYYASRIAECGESIDRTPIVMTVNSTPPVTTAINETWKSIAAGTGNSIAVRSDGTLWVWGDEYVNIGPTYRYSPQQATADANWVAVYDGGYKRMGLQADGEIFEWDNNQSPAIKVGTQTDWKTISTFGYGTDYHASAIKADGTLWTWGNNSNGELGDGTFDSKSTPTKVGTSSDWKTVANGYRFTLAIRNDGTLWAWGFNENGELGDGTTTKKNVPTQIGTANNWRSVSAGSIHVVATKSDSTLWTWGDNTYGKLGDGTTTARHTPTKIGTSTWREVSAGELFTVAIKSDGTLWAWGYGSSGAMGNPFSINDALSPVQVGKGKNWKTAVAGLGHILALTNDGILWAWGANERGELGSGKKFDSRPVPLPIPAKQFSCNQDITLADVPAQGTNIKWYNANSPFGILMPETSGISPGQHYYATQTINGLESCRRLDIVGDDGALLVPVGEPFQSFCVGATVAELSPSHESITWYTTATGHSTLSPTDVLVNGQEYFASQTFEGCMSATRLSVTAFINQPLLPTAEAVQTFCFFGTVGDLEPSVSKIYWYETETGGAPLPTTTPLVNGKQYWGLETGACASESRLMITAQLSETPAPTGAPQQTFSTGKTIADLSATGANLKWYPSPENASSGTNSLPDTELLVNNTTYFGTQTINDCESRNTLNVEVLLVTGTEQDEKALVLYPNPIDNILNISNTQPMDEVTVTNMLGQKIITKNKCGFNTALDFSRQESGVFVIQVLVGNKLISHRVIKK